MSTSVALAEQLLDLVKNVSDSNYNDPLSTWQKRIEIQRTCDRLLADVLGPREYTVLLAESCQESQALGFVNHYKVADIVGDNEVALADIAEQIQVQPKFLAVAMSCLLGRGYFEEVGGFGSHVYKNNQFSNIIRATHPSSVSDAVGFCTDEAFRATSRLTDAGKTDAEAPAISIAFGIEGGLFPVLNSEAYRVKRFGNAMQQLHGVANANVPADYDWHKLLSPIVDVGAGIGSLEIGLFKEETNRHLEFVIFDIPETIENSRKTWANHPSSSHISFISGSFLEPTLESSKLPPGAPTYIIRHVDVIAHAEI